MKYGTFKQWNITQFFEKNLQATRKIFLSEIIQIQKDKYGMYSLILDII